MLRFPVDYATVTSPFGNRTGGFHYGVDLGWHTTQNDPVYAADDGVVRASNVFKSDGAQFIIIYHEKLKMFTLYWHLSKRLVKNGDIVKQGQQIGNIGHTGKATDPHLHFEVWQNIEPDYLLRWEDEKKYTIDPLKVTYLSENQQVNPGSEKYNILRMPKTDPKDIEIVELKKQNYELQQQVQSALIERDNARAELSKFKPIQAYIKE